MEKKYIIKLEENEIAYKTVNSNGCPMIGLLHPAPYTEPDLEQVRKEAYERGAEDMRKALRLLIDCDDDCLTIHDIFHTFREGSYHAVVRKHPAMEIIEKIRQYEQRQGEQDGLRQNIQTIVDQCGYTLDEIAAVLEKMRDSE